MATYYAAPLDTVIEGMIPAAVRRGMGGKAEKLLSVATKLAPEERETLARRAPAQAKLYAFLEPQFKPQAKALVLARLKVGPAAVAALVKRGVLREETRIVVREAYADDWADGEAVDRGAHSISTPSRVPRPRRSWPALPPGNSESHFSMVSPDPARPRSICAGWRRRSRPAAA